MQVWWALSVARTAWWSNDKYGDRSWRTWWDHNMFVAPINGLLFCFAWFPTGLLAYHTILALTNQTTWEAPAPHPSPSRRGVVLPEPHRGGSGWQAFRADHISYLRNVPRGTLPFDRGLQQNLRLFFWPPQERCLQWRLLPAVSGHESRSWCAACQQAGCMLV